MLVLGLVAQIMILWSHRLELFSHSEGFIVCVGEYMIYLMTVRKKNYSKVISNNSSASSYMTIEAIELHFI